MHNPGEMNSERHYFALIGDIIDSRHEQDRYDVQKKLQSILSSVNAEHAAHIAADFLITLGDEFQGLLFAEKGADPIFVADRIIDEMFPVRIRIAIGFGGMATQIRREAAIGADGEAFYRARTVQHSGRYRCSCGASEMQQRRIIQKHIPFLPAAVLAS